MRIVAVFAALLLAATASPAQGPTAGPADLFPAGTLAYAEFRGPALADGLAALVKGTPWADSLASLPDVLDRADETGESIAAHTASLALATSPEALAELRRTRGAAAGLLGFSKRREPRYAAVALTGDSALAALAVRQRLTNDPELRRATTLDGVTVYQRRGPTPRTPEAPPGPLAPEKPFPPADDEPTYAAVPGLFVVGSDVEAVREVLNRFRRTDTTPALPTVPAFQAAHAAPDAVGFGYATPAACLAAWDRARSPVAPDPLGVARFLLDAPRWTALTGSLILQGDRVELVLHADYEKLPPLAEALAGPALPADSVARVRRPLHGDLVFTVPAGEGRAGRWLALADAVSAGRGALGRKPSQLVADLDRAAKGTAAGELLGTVAGLSVVHGPDGPVAVAHLDGTPAASRWPLELPRLLPDLLGPSAGVSSAVVGGTRLYTLQWGDEDARSRLCVAVTPHALYAAADAKAIEAMVKPTKDAANIALAKSRGVFSVATLLDAWSGSPPPAPPPLPPPADEPAVGGQAVPGVQLIDDVVIVNGRQVGVPLPPGLLDIALRRLRWLPPLAVDVATAPASPNRVTVTVRLPEPKATLRTLFDPPTLKAAAPAEKDAEKPVPAELP